MQDLTWLDNSKTTVAQINTFILSKSINLPSGLKKADKIAYLKAKLTLTAPIGYRNERISLIPKWMDNNLSWKTHLQLYGWCTVPIEGWQESFINDFFLWMESCSDNFKRDDPSTWTNGNMIPLIHGIIKHGMGQTELQWTVRELCYPIFRELLNTDELLCSFDGGCFLKSNQMETLEHNVKKLWVHVDTPRCLQTEEYISRFTGFPLDLPQEMECYQGIVNFVNNGEEDGGLVLVEESREFFHSYMNDYATTGFKWERANTVSDHFKDVTYIKICAPAGHLILWDGRMFHLNVPPSCTDPGKYRMCLYVSMQPKEFATKKELEKRWKLYQEGRMTGHWTYGPYFNANPKQPRTYGKVVVQPPPVEVAQLNGVRRKLIA